jgi:hypothetical protein
LEITPVHVFSYSNTKWTKTKATTKTSLAATAFLPILTYRSVASTGGHVNLSDSSKFNGQSSAGHCSKALSSSWWWWPWHPGPFLLADTLAATTDKGLQGSYNSVRIIFVIYSYYYCPGGYIVTFTKFLPLYHSWIHSLLSFSFISMDQVVEGFPSMHNTLSSIPSSAKKKKNLSRCRLPTPIILATQEAKIRRIVAQSQPEANSSWDPI